MIREVSIVQEMNHPNITPILDLFVNSVTKTRDVSLYIVFPYLDYDLQKYLKKFQIPEKRIKVFMHHLLQGLEYCHKHGVMHRDLKPQNLLIQEGTDLLQLADFGLARAFNLPLKTLTHEVETLWYRAPEVLLGTKSYELSIDIWSAGAIFAEMFKRRPVFLGDSEIDQIFKIF